MADVMHTIASIFSRPATSWGFGAIDKNEEVPVKIEEDPKINGDALMTYDDNSDSDIEIVGVVKLTPQPQNRPRANLTSTNAYSSNQRSNKQIGRKREESSDDITPDESPKKKIKMDDEEEKEATFGFPNKATTLSVDNPPTSLRKRPTAPSPELVKSLEKTGRGGPHHNRNEDTNDTQSQKSGLKSSAIASSITSNTAPSMNRRRMPFEEDDEEDDVEDGQPLELQVSRPKPAPTSSIFSRMWSEPQRSNSDLATVTPQLSTKGHRQLTTEKPSSGKGITGSTRGDGKAPPMSDSITYQPFKSTRTSGRPPEKPGLNSTRSDKSGRIETNLPGSDLSRDRHRPRLGGSLRVEAPARRDTNTSSGLLNSKPSIRNQENGLSVDTHATDPRKDSTAKTADTDETSRRVKRQENSRKRQEELTAKIKEGAARERFEEGEFPSKPQPEHPTTAAVPIEAHGNLPNSKAPSNLLHSPKKSRKKDQAANARKQADSRREREARERAQEKADAERRKWEEEHRRLEARRDEQKRKQIEAQNEANTMSERTKALSKLSQVKNPPKTNEVASKTNHRSKSSFGALLEEVAPRPEKTQPSRPIDEKNGAPGRPAAANQPNPVLQPPASKIGETTLPARSASMEQMDVTKTYRIQQKEEQNEQRRKAEKEREKRQPEDAPTAASQPTSTLQTLPTGPVSLNSVTGQKLVARSESPIPKSVVEPGRPPAAQHQNSQRNLGEILAQDIDLVKWRNTGMKYKEIEQLFEKKYQQHKVENTFRSRYKQVKQAVEDKSISDALRGRVHEGSEEARQELNKILHGSWPLPNATAPSNLPPSGGKRLTVKNGPRTHPLNSTSNEKQPSNVSPGPSFDSRNLPSSPAPETSQDQTHQLERPHTGGKTMDEKAFKYYLEGLGEAWRQHAEEEKARREPSPFTDDDYAPFAYQVQRRELSQEAIEAGEIIDDMGWVACDQPFDALGEANKEAIKQIFRGPEGRAPAVDPRDGFEHKIDINDGMAFHELRGKHGGLRHVQVIRFPRTLQRGVLPQSKDGWAVRTVFLVKQRTLKLPKDDMFGEVRERIVETTVDYQIYTDLDLANTAAIQKFVQMAFTPKSGHLTQRQIEIQEAEQQLTNELDEYGMFHENAKDDNGETVVDVWVEDAELVGPRNLY